ncbi:MAG: SAM-dependent methyltransferase [Candidatus Dormibacteraceae bacterium]
MTFPAPKAPLEAGMEPPRPGAAGAPPPAALPHSWAAYFTFSLGLGARSLRRGITRHALARIANPISYPRLIEFRLLSERLELPAGQRVSVLDIGSPKLPFFMLAARTQAELHATDVRDYFIRSATQFLEGLGLAGELGRRLFLETEDARQLTYGSASFDRVYSISVLEHIPGDGDGEAMAEMARILKPGGIAVLTVPYSSAGASETFVGADVYERTRTAKHQRLFYQRHYDDPALEARLVRPSGLSLRRLDYFGEPGFQFERHWNRVPMRWKLPFLWIQPPLAAALMATLPPEASARASGVCLTLCKE